MSDFDEYRTAREIESLETLHRIESQVKRLSDVMSDLASRIEPMVGRAEAMMNGTPTEKLRAALGREKKSERSERIGKSV